MGEEFLIDFILGAFSSGILITLYYRFKIGSLREFGREVLAQAEQEAEKIRHVAEVEAHQKSCDQQRLLEERWQNERRKIEKEELRLRQREEKTDLKSSEQERREKVLRSNELQIEEKEKQLEQERATLADKFQELSNLTRAEAREKFLQELKEEVRAESLLLIREKRAEAQEEADRQAGWILSTAIQRLAIPTVSQITTHTVMLPSEEMKGRIIGKEGRNIRTLERSTGITFLIDDTPGAIVLSGFDPMRLGVAKQALTELIADGRIHPTRIEEVVEKAQRKIEKKLFEEGEEAAHRAGQFHLHPELLKLLGKLQFLHSIGQNLLEHSLEVSHLMGMIAAELHLDTSLAKRIGLLHDIGKAASHEISGTHALIGRDLALKYGESEAVANGIGCHHNEIDPITVEGSFCGAADAISASRPGARIEAAADYIKRMERLEQVAHQFPGVEKAYAMQAGRELCIVVEPQIVDDNAALTLTKELTKRIEKELHYRGKIKITVIREKRTVAYAL